MPVVNLLRFKWDERVHWPAFGTLIKSISNSERAVRTAAVAEGKGIPQAAHETRPPNYFNLEPLFNEFEERR